MKVLSDCKTPADFADYFLDTLNQRAAEGWGQTRQEKKVLLTKVMDRAMEVGNEEAEIAK